MGMDALTLVREDHRRIEALLERFERLDGDGGDRAREALLRELQDEIRHHIDQEEAILFTIFRERARREELDLTSLDRAIQHHRLIERLSGELSDGVRDRVARVAKFRALVEQVRAHLDEEVTYVLPAIEDLIDDDTLIELGRRMEQRDMVIESRRQLVAVVQDTARSGWFAAALAGLAAIGTALLAILARRRRPPPQPAGWRRLRRR
jgi:hemerythrin-like domain-containing protein